MRRRALFALAAMPALLLSGCAGLEPRPDLPPDAAIPAGTGTVRGALIGAAAGGLLLGLGNLPEINPSASDFFRVASQGMLVGVVIGGAVGWALGGEAWRPARVPR